MTSLETIRKVIEACATAVESPFIRSDSDGRKPNGIFLSYKVAQGKTDPAVMETVTLKEIPEDEEHVERVSSRESEALVSIAIVGPGKGGDDIWNKAIATLAWLESEACRNLCREQDIFLRIPDPTIQDRTAWRETGHEMKLGFDIEVIGKFIRTEEIESIDMAATIAAMTEEGE